MSARKNDQCTVCRGTGVEHTQPAGMSQICSFCYGSGQRLDLGGLDRKRQELTRLRSK